MVQAIKGFPLLTGAFKGFGVSNNIKGFRAPNLNEIEISWVQGSRVPRLKGFHGLNVSRAPKVQGLQGFKG